MDQKAPLPMNRELIELIFDAASIRRWNDQINPMNFTELDKQAHKMIIAWVLARCENDRRPGSIDWRRLIEGSLFELFQRVILTDIKPPVFHRMMSENGPQVNEWVMKELSGRIDRIRGGFAQRMKRYFADEGFACAEKRLLKAAHYLATQWEFNILYKLCPFIRGIEQIKTEIENQIEDHYDLLGVQKIAMGCKTAGFVDLCGQLRFQKRWSQSPRIPATSVLGHMLIVALLVYLALCENECGEARKINGFLGGLFHDLPEVLTRDITSPVKTAVPGLDEIIKDYERLQMEEKLLSLVPSSWHRDLSYYTEQEFENRVRINGETKTGLAFEELPQFDKPEFAPVDGEIIRCCDHLAAFVEASTSINHGISSRHLKEGVKRLGELYRSRVVGVIDFAAVFEDLATL